LCARGAFVVDITWKDGRLANAVILSRAGNPLPIRYGEKEVAVPTEAGKRYRIDASLRVE
jgi:alpha-L-fucosidase 2